MEARPLTSPPARAARRPGAGEEARDAGHWLALADEDEWLAMLETGGIAPHEWAELDDNQRARVVELVVVEERPLVETLRLASDETKSTT